MKHESRPGIAGVGGHALLSLLAAMALAFASLPAIAHEGHDHGDEAKPVALPQMTPRFEATSDLFEVVGVAGGDGLTLYLDRFADNRPVIGARLEIDGPLKGVAKEIAPAVYRVAAPPLPPGKHALTLTIGAGEDSDLLMAELRIEPPSVAAAPVAVGIAPGQALVAGVVTVALLGIGWQLRRRKGVS